MGCSVQVGLGPEGLRHSRLGCLSHPPSWTGFLGDQHSHFEALWDDDRPAAATWSWKEQMTDLSPGGFPGCFEKAVLCRRQGRARVRNGTHLWVSLVWTSGSPGSLGRVGIGVGQGRCEEAARGRHRCPQITLLSRSARIQAEAALNPPLTPACLLLSCLRCSLEIPKPLKAPVWTTTAHNLFPTMPTHFSMMLTLSMPSEDLSQEEAKSGTPGSKESGLLQLSIEHWVRIFPERSRESLQDRGQRM